MAAVTTVHFRVAEADYVRLSRLRTLRPGPAAGCFGGLGVTVAAVVLLTGASGSYAVWCLCLLPAVGAVALLLERQAPRWRYRRSPPLQNELTLHFTAAGFRLCTRPPSDLEEPGRVHGAEQLDEWLLLRLPLLPERFVPVPLTNLPPAAREQLLHLFADRAELPVVLALPSGQDLCWFCRRLVARDDAIVVGGKCWCRQCKAFGIQACLEGVAHEAHRSDRSAARVAAVTGAVSLALAGAAVRLRLEADTRSHWFPPTPEFALPLLAFLLFGGPQDSRGGGTGRQVRAARSGSRSGGHAAPPLAASPRSPKSSRSAADRPPAPASGIPPMQAHPEPAAAACVPWRRCYR